MDQHRFDTLTRSLSGASSRRALLRGLAGLGLGLGIARLPQTAAAKKRKQNKKRPHIFQDLTIHTKSGHRNIVECGGEVTFEIDAQDFDDLRDATCGIAIHNERGNRVVFFHTRYHSGFTFDGQSKAKFTCTVPSLPLIPGSYYVELVMADGYGIIEQIERVDRLDVTPANVLGTGMLPKKHQGYFVLPATWTKE